MSNIRDIIKDKFEYLKTCGIDTSISEVKMLLADVLNTDTGNLRFYNKNLTPDDFYDYLYKAREVDANGNKTAVIFTLEEPKEVEMEVVH